VQAQIAGLDLDDDERDDMTPLLMLIALLRARGQRVEDLRDDEFAGEGMDRVRQQVLAQLRRLAHGARLPVVEASALCSARRHKPHLHPWRARHCGRACSGASPDEVHTAVGLLPSASSRDFTPAHEHMGHCSHAWRRAGQYPRPK